jgi:hypothetical protein
MLRQPVHQHMFEAKKLRIQHAIPSFNHAAIAIVHVLPFT